MVSRKFDAPSYTLQPFVPAIARDTYLAIRALNVELARIPEATSDTNISLLRMQFWQRSLESLFAEGSPAQEPVARLLQNALLTQHGRDPSLNIHSIKAWLSKILEARIHYVDDRPFPTLSALEAYAENTHSTLLYVVLSSMSMQSLAADHVASHIGKASGLATVLRGLPLVAFPATAHGPRNNAISGHKFRPGTVNLPLDVMAECGVRQEDVLRYGNNADGLREVVFQIATRANDHLITAQTMVSNLRRGESTGHDFEHHQENSHTQTIGPELMDNSDMMRSFGVFMSAIPTKLWLERLQKCDFDVFHPDLRKRDWRLPWKAYIAFIRKGL